ncbi:unnamed protein product [Linum tenue]|uniref:Uncharacterized protein n=1 Tax=Linum tenue TaxID=586396 RepID=A0AAV0MH26_9ROSI|nr:unnamed protein product [Linum tenue]
MKIAPETIITTLDSLSDYVNRLNTSKYIKRSDYKVITTLDSLSDHVNRLNISEFNKISDYKVMALGRKFKLIKELTIGDKKGVLKLRLLHSWHSTNPANPGYVYDYSTLWVDETGMLIHGLSDRTFAGHSESKLTVGSVYDFISDRFEFCDFESLRERVGTKTLLTDDMDSDSEQFRNQDI